MQFVIEPHKGIGPISFGMSREEVTAIMARNGGGIPKQRGRETDCFFLNAFQVSYDDAGRADFIEVASGLSAVVLFAGCDVFDMSADELLALIQKQAEPDSELSRPPHEFTFSDLILTLWEQDTQYDYKGGHLRRVFAAVGVGAPSYLAAIRDIVVAPKTAK